MVQKRHCQSELITIWVVPTSIRVSEVAQVCGVLQALICHHLQWNRKGHGLLLGRSLSIAHSVSASACLTCIAGIRYQISMRPESMPSLLQTWQCRAPRKSKAHQALAYQCLLAQFSRFPACHLYNGSWWVVNLRFSAAVTCRMLITACGSPSTC